MWARLGNLGKALLDEEEEDDHDFDVPNDLAQNSFHVEVDSPDRDDSVKKSIVVSSVVDSGLFASTAVQTDDLGTRTTGLLRISERGEVGVQTTGSIENETSEGSVSEDDSPPHQNRSASRGSTEIDSSEVSDLKAQLDDVRSAYDSISLVAEDYRDRVKQLHKDCALQKQQLGAWEEKCAALEESAQTAQRQLEQDLEKARADSTALEQQLARIRGEKTALEKQTAEQRRKLGALEEADKKYIDKRLARSLIFNFFKGGAFKESVSRLASQLLEFSEEEKRELGIQDSAGSGSGGRHKLRGDKSKSRLSEMWVQYLEQSVPKRETAAPEGEACVEEQVRNGSETATANQNPPVDRG